MNEEASCARIHCCKMCVAPNSRTKTATSFPGVRRWPHIFFIWRNDFHCCVCFVANFLCYNIAKYFKDRSATHRVIAKIKRVPVFLNTVYRPKSVNADLAAAYAVRRLRRHRQQFCRYVNEPYLCIYHFTCCFLCKGKLSRLAAWINLWIDH